MATRYPHNPLWSISRLYVVNAVALCGMTRSEIGFNQKDPMLT